MAKTIYVKDGDCLINICAAAHLSWETVWNHPENAELRSKRKHPNILKRGDRLYLPDPDPRWATRPTGRVHSFVLKTPSVRFSLTLRRLGQPRANMRYTIEIDNHYRREGLTDAQGQIELPIPADARRGTLCVGNDEPIELEFGGIDPIDELSGVQTRLYNLGFYHGPCDGEMTPETAAAIAEFKRSVDLPGEDTLDDEVRRALVNAHGS